MVRKIAIADKNDVEKFLRAAATLEDEVRTYMMLAFGIHPENMRKLKARAKKGDRITEDGVIEFKRAKNSVLRRELMSPGVTEVVLDVTSRNKLKVSNTYLEQICASQGVVLPDYPTKPVSPMTLRHTFALNELKLNKFDYFLVAGKMGCDITVLRQNYLDLLQWERVRKQPFSEPYDLTHWKFGENNND